MIKSTQSNKGALQAGTLHILVVGGVVAALAALAPQTDIDSKGTTLYTRWCASCHGVRGEGLSAPPLYLFRDYPDEFWKKTILGGVPGTPMQPVALSAAQLEELIAYIRTLPKQKKTPMDTIQIRKLKPIVFSHLEDLTAVVLREDSIILLLENQKPTGTLKLTGYVHGGLKWWHSRLFIPERQGVVHAWFVQEGRLISRKLCDHLRSIDLSESALLAVCWAPAPVVYQCDRALQRCVPFHAPCIPSQLIHVGKGFTILCRDTPLAYTYQEGNWKQYRLIEPVTDVLLSPEGRYILTSWRYGTKILVYDGDNWRIAACLPGTMAHLSASAWWYYRGGVYAAIPLMKENRILILEAFKGDTPVWNLQKYIPTRSAPAFARTCPHTPYIWADENSTTLLLIDKLLLKTQRLTLDSISTLSHTEFDRQCSKAFISVKGNKEGIWIVDAVTLDSLAFIEGKAPAGKYNWWHKHPQANAIQLGEEIYLRYCWGCHHPTQQAFAPPLRLLATLPASFISHYMEEPHGNMPPVSLSKNEKLLLLQYITSLNYHYAEGH